MHAELQMLANTLGQLEATDHPEVYLVHTKS